jgi:integrase/recombinase XerD
MRSMAAAAMVHRDSQSLSAYVRIATQTLREVSLPVPR